MPVKNYLFLLISAVILLSTGSGELYGQTNVVKKTLKGYGEVEYVEGELIFRYKDDETTLQKEARSADESDTRLQSLTQFRNSRSERVRLNGMTVEEGLEEFRNHPDVEFVEPNFVYRLIQPVRQSSFTSSAPMQADAGEIIPDDTFFGLQWGLRNNGEDFLVGETVVSKIEGADINAHQAWDLTTGSDDVIIAILDSGIDYEHEDLEGNLFRDDEDRFGIDTSPGTDSPDDPMDEDGHGTHVAGVIGAIGNNGTGIAGINWNTRLMAIRVFNNEDETTVSSIVEGLEYAIENGAKVSNHSYGGTGFSQTLFEAFEKARDVGHLVVAAAGNNEIDNDGTPFYPASYDLDNIISVAASDQDDQLANFSNFGATSVHIAAPGSFIGSTFPDNGYIYLSGTSMAVPHVVGVAGLVQSFYPNATYQDIRNRILDRADPLESLDGRVQDSRRLNAVNALLDINPDKVSDLELVASGQKFVSVKWTAVSLDGHQGTVANYDLRISESPITAGNFNQADLADAEIIPKVTGEPQRVILSGLEPEKTYYLAIKAVDNFENASDISNIIQFSTSAPPSKQVTGDLDQGGKLNVTLNTGESHKRTLRISNNGPGPLQVRAPGRFRPVSLMDQEPRSFPYLFSSSRVEGAPPFHWEGISSSGRTLEFQNSVNGSSVIDLPFDFPFYTEMKDSLYVSVNGFLSFLPVTNVDQSGQNVEIPFSARPNDLIAVHWSNFELASDSEVFTYHDSENERFIIQWDQLKRYPASLNPDQSYTFQAILYKGGAVQMQYLQTNPEFEQLTIGLENRLGVNGVSYAYNQSIGEEFSITFLPGQPDWLEVNDVNLSLGQGGAESIEVSLNAGALVPGEYYSEIFILDNDLNAELTRIPVVLTVEGESAFVQFIHASLDLSLSELDIFINKKMLRHNLIFNTRTDSIEVPAGIDLLTSVITENSSSVDDAIEERTLRFEPDKRYLALAEGMSSLDSPSTPGDFDFFIHEFVDEEEDDEKIRFLFFNGVADATSIGLIGFYPDSRPPVVLKEDLPYGQFSETVSAFPIDFELDVVEGSELFDSFKFNNNSRGGETVVSVITGYADAGPEVPELTILNSHAIGAGRMPDKITSAGSVARHIPNQLEVEENYPNPFNPVTKIQFSLPESRDVRLVIYDVLGRTVQTLVDESLSAGIHNVTFNGTSLSSGVYFYQIQAGGDVMTKKMVLVK